MRALKSLLIPAVLVLVGIILYPSVQGLRKLTPDVLLENVVKAEKKTSYLATQIHTYSFYGKMRHYQVEVKRNGCELSWKAEGYDDHTEYIPACWIGGDRSLALVRKNYTPLIEGEDTVADRSVWTLRLKPKNKSFPWKQLWIDKKTFVVLASRDWNSENKIKNTMRTVHIEYTKPPTGDQTPQSGQNSVNSSYIPMDNKTVLNQKHSGVLLPGYMPDGFELSEISSLYKKNGTHVVYSDGLYSISIFENVLGKSKPVDPVSDWGQGKQFTADVNGVHIIIMADLPIGEMKKIAASLRL